MADPVVQPVTPTPTGLTNPQAVPAPVAAPETFFQKAEAFVKTAKGIAIVAVFVIAVVVLAVVL